jgi:hypothetical protein
MLCAERSGGQRGWEGQTRLQHRHRRVQLVRKEGRDVSS